MFISGIDEKQAPIRIIEETIRTKEATIKSACSRKENTKEKSGLGWKTGGRETN